MRELSLDKVKQIEIDMLACIDKVCRNNGIKYSITYGTLIGAIRHKGFIPWDDDIDVMMSRDEYDKFLSVWEDGDYKLLTLKRGSEFWPLFSRITDPHTILEPPKICNHGVWVAVIPYDKIPDNPNKRKRHLKKIERGIKLLEIKRSNIKCNSLKSVMMKMIQIALIPFTPYMIGKQVERIKTKYRNSDCTQVNPWKDNIIVNADIFDEYIDVEFEGLTVMAIKQYDPYLRYQYGDYMQLPPVEERVCPHNYTAYAIN